MLDHINKQGKRVRVFASQHRGCNSVQNPYYCLLLLLLFMRVLSSVLKASFCLSYMDAGTHGSEKWGMSCVHLGSCTHVV